MALIWLPMSFFKTFWKPFPFTISLVFVVQFNLYTSHFFNYANQTMLSSNKLLPPLKTLLETIKTVLISHDHETLISYFIFFFRFPLTIVTIYRYIHYSAHLKAYKHLTALLIFKFTVIFVILDLNSKLLIYSKFYKTIYVLQLTEFLC